MITKYEYKYKKKIIKVEKCAGLRASNAISLKLFAYLRLRKIIQQLAQKLADKMSYKNAAQKCIKTRVKGKFAYSCLRKHIVTVAQKLAGKNII